MLHSWYINLEYIDVEGNVKCYDSVKIYDGDSTKANQLGPSDGNGFCGSCAPPTLTSTGSSLLIVFISDESNDPENFHQQGNAFYGFDVTYKGKPIKLSR